MFGTTNVPLLKPKGKEDSGANKPTSKYGLVSPIIWENQELQDFYEGCFQEDMIVIKWMECIPNVYVLKFV